MATKATANTFKKFDTDTSQNKQDNSSFYDAENLRLITDEALSNGALVNFKGTKAKLNLGKEIELKGYSEVDDTLGLLLYQKPLPGNLEGVPSQPANIPINNFTTTSSSYSNLYNTLLVKSSGSETVTGPSSSNLEVGQLLLVENTPVPTPLVLLPGYTYKINYGQSILNGFPNTKYSVVVGKSTIQGVNDTTKALSTIPVADVLHIFTKTSTNDSSEELEFSIPSDVTEDIFIAFYPTELIIDGSNYSLEIFDNSIYFANIFIQYKESVDYTDITSLGTTQPVLPEFIEDQFVPLSEDFSASTGYTYVDVYMNITNSIDNSSNPVEYTIELSKLHPVNGYVEPVVPISIKGYSDDTVIGNTIITDNPVYKIVNPLANTTVHIQFKFLSSSIPDLKLFTFIHSSGNASAVAGTTITDFTVNQVTAGTEYEPIPEVISYTSTLKYNVTLIKSSFINVVNVLPNVNGGLVKGSKYLLPISFTSPSATSATVEIFGQDGVVHQKFILSNPGIVTTFTVDLTNVFSTDAYAIRLLAGINETITYNYGNIKRVLPYVEFYTIPDNSAYISNINISNAVPGSTVSNVILSILHPTTKVVQESFTVPTNGTTVSLKYKNYNGYKLAVNTSPSVLKENGINITNFLVHKIVTEETYIADLTINKYYEFVVGAKKDNTYDCVGKSIQIIIKNTSVIPATIVKTLDVPVSTTGVPVSTLKYFVPTGGAYKLYAKTQSDTDDILAAVLTGNPTMVLSKYSITASGSIIAKAVVSEDNTIQNIVKLYSDVTSSTKLGFDTVNHIETAGRYDSSYVKNIYFAVPGHPVRSFNLAPTPVSPSTAEATTLDLLPNVEGSVVSIKDVIDGGDLESGKIQYACRLFNKYGNESAFSTTSELVSLTTSSVSGSSEFKGSDIEVSSGKSVKIEVDLSNNTIFDYVRIYSIHYKEKDVPVISMVAELPIGNNSVISFVDTGTILSPVTVEEFNIFGGRLVSAETLATKNNILFAGNISEQISNITEEDLDCRAYRFDSSTTAEVFESDSEAHPVKYVIDSLGETAKGVWNGSSYTYTVLGSNFDVPVDANCINKYNDEFLVPNENTVHPFPYMYQSDGVTLGGTGKIIDYKIKVEDNYTKLVNNGETTITNDNINYILKSTSFKQGETYRIGITFYDLKGKPFFNRWIGDIRMPYMDLFISKYTRTDTSGTENVEMFARNMYLEVTVKTANISQTIKDKISGFQITKVERTSLDRSVVAQGYSTGGVTYDKGINKYLLRGIPTPYELPFDPAINTYKPLFNYMTQVVSPEFNINEGISADSQYRLKVVKILANPILRVRAETNVVIGGTTSTSGWLGNQYYHIMGGSATNASSSKIFYPLTEILFNSNTYSQVLNGLTGSVNIVPGYSFNINKAVKYGKEELGSSGSQLLPNNTPAILINRVVSDTHKSELNGGTSHTGYSSTGLVVSFNTSIPYLDNFTNPYNTLPPTNIDHTYIYVFDLYKNTANNRYSGNTYASRSINVYHAISKFTELSSPVANAYGDTYNTIFDTLYGYNDGNIEDDQVTDVVYASDVSRRQYVGLFPIESSINTMLVSNKPSKWIYNYPSGRNLSSKYIGLMEKAIDGANMYGDKYPDVGDFNRYNTAYSAINKYPVLVQEPLLFQEITQQPYTILASEVSVSGDLVDNWTKFLTSNFIDLDSSHGAVHKLTSFDNKLYFLQEEAVGIVAVKDRYILTEGPTQLALGTGGVLERYDYLKYNTGILNPSQAINITSGLYYVDIARKVINTLRELDVSMSLEKGINSLVRKLLSNSSVIELGYDVKYNELYITILNSTESKTLVYNEVLGQFTPNISYKPLQWLSLKDGAYSYIQSITGLDNYIYRHNVGNYNEIYTEAGLPISGYTDSYVSVLVNPNSNIVNVYDAIDFRTEVLDTNSDIFNDSNTYETVDEISFKNSYQSVNKQIVVRDGTNLKPNTSRRARAWTTQVPLSQNNKRFLDTFLSVTFKYFGSANKIFKLHDIITYYREYHK